MTREELINVIYKSSDKSATCPTSYCLEFMVKDNCLKCAERQLAEYEKQIRNAAIDDCIEYFSLHAKEIHEHVSARDFICDRLEQLKGE